MCYLDLLRGHGRSVLPDRRKLRLRDISDFALVTQLVSGRTGAWSQVCDSEAPSLPVFFMVPKIPATPVCGSRYLLERGELQGPSGSWPAAKSGSGVGVRPRSASGWEGSLQPQDAEKRCGPACLLRGAQAAVGRSRVRRLKHSGRGRRRWETGPGQGQRRGCEVMRFWTQFANGAEGVCGW